MKNQGNDIVPTMPANHAQSLTRSAGKPVSQRPAIKGGTHNTTAIGPLASTPSAQASAAATHHPSCTFDWRHARQPASTPTVVNNVNSVSINTKRPEIKNPQHDNSPSPASQPVVCPNKRAPNPYTATIVNRAAAAGTNRAAVSEIPNRRKLAAVIQYSSGGLSRYGLPNWVGTT